MAHASQLLSQHYRLSPEHMPQQRNKAAWLSENNCGFLRGIAAFGRDTHSSQLFSLLRTSQFQDQEQSFMDSLFDYYIRPFHKCYNNEFCRTPSAVSSRTPSRSNSIEDLDFVPEEKELVHKDLKRAVMNRDQVCLFCWDRLECEGAHIIAQKNMIVTLEESSLLQQAGLTHKHQVQNGLLLCNKCHSQFDKLKRYVDVIDDNFVVKLVNEANDTFSDKHKDWEEFTRDLEIARSGRQVKWSKSDNRQAVESNGEMRLYFAQNDANTLPNRTALEFHKMACLIWKMAGGIEPDEEYCSDDDDNVKTDALKKRYQLPAQDSSFIQSG